MSTVPTVVVKKGGFLSALFSGLFGFLIATVVCVCGLGFYALHIANTTAGSLLGLSGSVITSLPQWQDSLPPTLAEILNDRRAPDYRDELEISVRVVPAPEDRSRELMLVNVYNDGSETVTVLALNLSLENEDGVPLVERRVYAATPIAVDDGDWRGPLLPGESRKFAVRLYSYHGMSLKDTQAELNVAEIRLWNGPDVDDTDESITRIADGD